MKLMESWCPRNPMACVFSMKDIPHIRVRLALDNLFSEHNKEDAGKNLVLNFNLKASSLFLFALFILEFSFTSVH